MSIVIELAPLQEHRLNEEALRHGISTSELIERTLAERFPIESEEDDRALALIDQWIAEAPKDPQMQNAAEEDLVEFQKSINETLTGGGISHPLSRSSMSRTIFLDTGPLGIITNPRRPAATVELLRWAAAHIRAGSCIHVPAIADYEVRRELSRLGRIEGLTSLDYWNSVPSDRYVALTDSALRLASKLWGDARNAGTATADPKELDCDVLIAAQVLDYQTSTNLVTDEVIVATVNVGHLSLYVHADSWQNIQT